MQSPDSEISALDYRAPRIFFAGEYRYRSMNGTIACGFALLFAGACSAVTTFDGSGTVERVVRMSFIACAVAFAIAVFYFIWAWSVRRTVRVEINEDGVIHGRKFWSWANIRCVRARKDSFGVFPVVECYARALANNLLLTPSLSEQDYHQLADALRKYLETTFPNVKIKREILQDE